MVAIKFKTALAYCPLFYYYIGSLVCNCYNHRGHFSNPKHDGHVYSFIIIIYARSNHIISYTTIFDTRTVLVTQTDATYYYYI